MVAVSKSKTKAKTVQKHPFISKTPKNFRLGGCPPPKRDLSHFVRWPTCVQLQRKRAILLSKLKTPNALKPFQNTLSKNEATQLFRLLGKYRPEADSEKKERLVKEAEARAADKETKTKKPSQLKSGLNHITELVEQKKAKLVIIAHDVDPIELVVWLPTLCKKMEVPCVVVKGKARLGALVHQKTAAVLAIDSVRKEDQPALDQIIKNIA